MSELVSSDPIKLTSEPAPETIEKTAPVKLNKYLAATINPLPILKSKN